MTTKFYSKVAEGDLRQELIDMFDGTGSEIAKSHKGLLRRMRRDSNDALIECSCVDELTQEPDMDFHCPFCLGEGYFWDEEWIDVRRTYVRGSEVGFTKRDLYQKIGTINVQTLVFYLKSTVTIDYYDRIVELRTNKDGSIYTPHTRLKLYRPQTIVPYRSDNGRLEYWAVHCSEKEAVVIDNNQQRYST